MIKQCFNCKNPGILIFEYIICDSCKKKLGLFTDKKLKEYIKKDPNFKKEINRRLDFIEKDYIKKKIKLLYIKERLKHI